MTDEVRPVKCPWTVMFSDYLIYSESKEQVEGGLDRWRYALVRRRKIKASRSKMEYVCEGEGDRWKGKRPRSRDKEVRCA